LKTRYAASISFVCGLFTAQIIASLQVWISNLSLHEKMYWIAEAGYLTVPGPKILPTLKMVTPAIFGGLFFTLSIGTGISLMSLACVWILKYGCRNKKPLAILFLGIWSTALIALNWHGFVLMPTLYAVLVPIIVGLPFWKLGPDTIDRRSYTRLLLHVLVILLLAALWWTQKSDTLFINIRDNLLLSNKPGIAFNDFYYRYTLYPAEAFRSHQQMLIKTYHLSNASGTPDRNRIVQKLNNADYLLINEKGKADIDIAVDGQRIRLTGNRQGVIESDVIPFVSRPRQNLRELSQRNDAYLHFRKATSIALLVGFPVMLYWLLNAFLAGGFSLFFGRHMSVIAAIIVSCLLGVLLLLLMPDGGRGMEKPEGLSEMLLSGDRKTIVTALKQIEAREIDLHTFRITETLIQHPSIAVRYWLARGLSVGSNPGDQAHLAALMLDPHPNVACQAIYSLGKRKFRTATAGLVQLIKTSDHWYVQLYAYGALRKLGWKQTISN